MIRITTCHALIIYSFAFAGCAQPAEESDKPLTNQAKADVVSVLADKLQSEYPIEEQATVLERKLRAKLEAGGYTSVNAHSEFATTLTNDLVDWSTDKHFMVWHVGKTLPPLTNLAGAGQDEPLIEVLPENFSFLRNIRKLSNKSKDSLSDLLNSIDDSEALIIDLRECAGGDRDAIIQLASHFFEPPMTLFTSLERDEKPKEHPVLKGIRGKRLLELPIFILTSKNTASGGEAFAYLMKHHARAEIIGEQTMGAAHTVRTYDLVHDFRAFIPYRRSTHPVTGTDWEGIGVVTDIGCPADSAVDVAIKVIRGR